MNKRQKVMDCVDSARLVRDTVLDNLNNGLFADMKQSMYKNNPTMLNKTQELLGSWRGRLKLFDHKLMSQIEALDTSNSDSTMDEETHARKKSALHQLHQLLDRVKQILALMNNSMELLDVVSHGIESQTF